MKTREELRIYQREYMRRYRSGAAPLFLGVDKQKERARTERYRKSEKGKATKKAWKSTPEQRQKARLSGHLLRGAPPPTRVMPEFCECCKQPANGQGLFHLDHCHETDIFRGWLCFKCNAGIGNLGDDVEGLENALSYLRRAYSIQSNTESTCV